MAIIEETLSSILEGGVKTKGKKGKEFKPLSGKNTRSTFRMVAGKAPEVMTKITGFSGGAKHVHAHLKYISRDGEYDLENDRGQVFKGKEEVEEAFSDWADQIKSAKKSKRDVMHLMLSMPAGTDPNKVKDAARNFAKNTFSDNHEYLFALHTDTPHPHVHLAVKMVGYDRTKLNPRKNDIQAWRESFATELRSLGVAAAATNRRARGVTKKPINNIVYNINKGDKTHKKRVARVTALQTNDAVDDLIAKSKGLPEKDKPWINAIKEDKKVVKGLYKLAIKELGKTGKTEDKALAKDLKTILASLPNDIVTQHDELKQLAQISINKDVIQAGKDLGSNR